MKKEFTDQQNLRFHLITLLLFSMKDINVTYVHSSKLNAHA